MKNRKHLKWQAGALAAAVALSQFTMAMTVSAASVRDSSTAGTVWPTNVAVDADGEVVESTSACTYGEGYMNLDTINPGQTIYIPLGTGMDLTLLTDTSGNISSSYGGSPGIGMNFLTNSDYFKLSTEKDGTGKSLISSVSVVTDKVIGSSSRQNYLQIVIKDSTTTTDLKAKLDITFKARANKTESAVGISSSSNPAWVSGDVAKLTVTMWINNTEITGTDGSAESGSGVYFNPESNDTNSLVWGDDRAAVTFATDSDADSFYAKLSTKVIGDIYTAYGDPANAELYFYDFVGNPTVPSTSRATLTLGIPWSDDDAYVPDPLQCYIYQMDVDGALVDITEQFTYSEEDYEIPGWSYKTRTLGTYILSDTELDIYAEEEWEDVADDTADDTTSADSTTTTEKVIPDTGTADFTGLAVSAGAISLAAVAAMTYATKKRAQA